MLFYILLHSSGTAVRDCKCTAIIHGCFTPSIILSAISSRSSKRDPAYSACWFPSRTRRSFPEAKYSHRIADGTIQITYHSHTIHEAVSASMHNFATILPEDECFWTLSRALKCLFYCSIKFYDSPIHHFPHIFSRFTVLYVRITIPSI